MKKSFVIYVLLSLVIWRLGESVSKIITRPPFRGDNPLFSITELTNDGAAFGILENNPFILGTLGVLVIILTAYFVYKKLNFQDKTKLLYSAIFTGGILGNTVERLQFGFVYDFIKINLFNFPVFNLYDVLICTAVILFLKDEVNFGKRKAR